jgi:hypothetical protein
MIHGGAYIGLDRLFRIYFTIGMPVYFFSSYVHHMYIAQ